MTIGILGGGLCGLVIGANLKQPYEILEADERVGGHCRSLVKDGYTFDIGGPHIIFSKDQKILNYMIGKLGDNIVEQKRNVKILYDGKLIKYPFENGIYDLSPQERFECVDGFINNSYIGGNSLKDWLYRTFGKGLTEKYLIPYNEKIWNTRTEDMSDDWVEGRIPKPSVTDILKSSCGVETEGNLHQLYFKYPKIGGIESLAQTFAKDCKNIITGFKVSKVDNSSSKWHIFDRFGKIKEYDKLISTIPIQDLIRALSDVPRDVIDAVNSLRFNSLITIMLGWKSSHPIDETAIYIPDPNIPYHRISFQKNLSNECVPEGCNAAMYEITVPPDDIVYNANNDYLINWILETSDIDPSQINFKNVHRTKYAYVIRTFDYAKNLKLVLDYVDSLGIISCGRNAEFAYINMDEAIRRGLAVAEKLQ